MTPSLVDAALAYAARGWRVHPNKPNSKLPKYEAWTKIATTDPDTIRQWFAEPSNLGIATGAMTDERWLVVLDVDRKQGVDGEVTLQSWEADHAPLPRTYTVKTPHNGTQYYFWSTVPLPTKTSLAPGLDIRGVGGQVLAPPSEIDGIAYQESDASSLHEISQWLSDKILAGAPKRRKTFAPGTRNTDLTSVAGALRRTGVEASTLETALAAINATLPIPLPAVEVSTIAESVGQYPPAEAPPWAQYHIPMTQKSQPICNANSALGILEQHPNFHDSIWFDIFSQRMMTSWETAPRAWRDADTQRLLVFLQRELNLQKMSRTSVEDAVGVFVETRRRHAVLDWLKTMEWDQTARIDTCLTQWFGAPDTPYIHAASRNFWLGLIARISRPGCQSDHMLVLEGPQGQGKTSALRILGGTWYLSVSESVMHKDFFQALPGHLIVEIAELDSFRRAELTRIKQVISTPADHYRPAYGRHSVTYERQCIFVGTTNEDRYLRDMTGARRFWPIPCGTIDLPALRAQRDQLFAEAAAQYRNGVSWWEMPETATEEQEARREVDVWESPIAEYLLVKDEVTLKDVLCDAALVPLGQADTHHQRRAGAILRRLGWQPKSIRRGTIVLWKWCAPERQPGELLSSGDFEA